MDFHQWKCRESKLSTAAVHCKRASHKLSRAYRWWVFDIQNLVVWGQYSFKNGEILKPKTDHCFYPSFWMKLKCNLCPLMCKWKLNSMTLDKAQNISCQKSFRPILIVTCKCMCEEQRLYIWLCVPQTVDPISTFRSLFSQRINVR